jgi:hypothetical protein
MGGDPVFPILLMPTIMRSAASIVQHVSQDNCRVRGLVHFSARRRILLRNGRPNTWTCPLRFGTLQLSWHVGAGRK